MPRYMLDTDTCSYVMKRSNAAVLRKLRRAPVSDVCISIVTLAELRYGVEVSPRPQQDSAALEGFLLHLETVPLTADDAAHYANIRANLKTRGQMIGANDLFIAAHARSRGLTLVTNNTGEFRRVPGLKIENWTTSARRSRPVR